jgi:hypothetical protein
MADRTEFIARSAPLKEIIKTVEKNVSLVTHQIQKGEITPGKGYYRLCQESLFGASCYLGINRLAFDLMGTKNLDAINSSRKMIFNALIAMEKVVPTYLNLLGKDEPIPEEKKLGLTLQEQYAFVKKFALAIDMLIKAYDDQQLELTFLDMQGRFAVVALNIMDIRGAIKSYMAMEEDYNLLCHFFPLQKKLLLHAAFGYRTRYEAARGTGKESDDLSLGIRYLETVVHLADLLRDPEAPEYRKKLELWEGKRS